MRFFVYTFASCYYGVRLLFFYLSLGTTDGIYMTIAVVCRHHAILALRCSLLLIRNS